MKVATGEHVQNRIVFKQMLQAGALDEEQLAQLLADQMGIEYLPDLDDEPVSDKLGSHLLRLDAVQFSAVPYKLDGDTLVVAIADPRQIGRAHV